MNTGTQLSMTLDWVSPKAFPRMPSWNTATSTPKAAPWRAVERDRLDRDHERMEYDEQEQERKAEHEPEHERDGIEVGLRHIQGAAAFPVT